MGYKRLVTSLKLQAHQSERNVLSEIEKLGEIKVLVFSLGSIKKSLSLKNVVACSSKKNVQNPKKCFSCAASYEAIGKK